MQTLPTLLASLLATVAVASAQTQTVRGKVEDVPNTTNQYYLDGTTISLVSSRLALNALVGQQWILQVIDRSTSSQAILDVQSAVATTKIFDMGNLRFGRAESWQVNAAPGSRTAVLAAPTAWTSYIPVGPMGTWLLGVNAVPMAAGVVSGQGQFEFRFTMPAIPSLVGVSFSGQAIVETNGAHTLSNVDAKEVRSD